MSKLQVIIDCDPGVDDAAAILLALASPEIELLGLSVVAGNVPLDDTLANACKIIGISGRRDVAVYAGASGPLVRDQVYGKYARIGTFADDLMPPGDIAPARENAVQFLVRSTHAAAVSGDPITICAIGPMTDLALALTLHPDTARGINRIICMAGAFRALGHRTPWAEFNVYADPHAADVVLRSGIPIVMMPLDVTFQALFTSEHIAAFRRGGRAGEALCKLFTAFDRSDIGRFGRPGGPIHDAMTVAWLLRPELFSGQPAHVGVETRGETMGHTYADFTGKLGRKANVTVITGVDEAGFIELLTERIARHAGSCARDGHKREAEIR
ncbi:nucleoside hydrolase [Martelella soudanensis]|uniref:nucleoside hydrolase n=1 Tax=unclassified Martelella TaxID=2629616 RepID=UPI0015DE0690|nr:MULTISPECIES: nucleoside hydrolase [unclassified Martelella]